VVKVTALAKALKWPLFCYLVDEASSRQPPTGDPDLSPNPGGGAGASSGPKPRPPSGDRRPASASDSSVRSAALVRLAWRVAAALGVLEGSGRQAMAEAMDKNTHEEAVLVSRLEAALAAHPGDDRDAEDGAERAESPISDAGSLVADRPVTTPAAAHAGASPLSL